jgi:AcrR family transcriptional regulator
MRGGRRRDILRAAQQLFAERGYHAVSIRQIAAAAGVPLALVGYYFGPKHELFHALFEQWRHTIEERVALLEQARQHATGQHALRRIVHAFVAPVLQLRATAEGEHYALLVARELGYRSPEAERVMVDFFDPMAHAFIDALQAQSRQAERGQVAWCYQFALGALLHHLIDTRVQRLSQGASHSGDAVGASLLVEFIVGGIEAALQSPPDLTDTVPPTPRRRRRQT